MAPKQTTKTPDGEGGGDQALQLEDIMNQDGTDKTPPAGDPPADPPAGSKMVTVTDQYGQAFEVPEAQASVIQQSFDNQKREAEHLRVQYNHAAGVNQAKADDAAKTDKVAWGDLLVEDPEQFVDKLTGSITQALTTKFEQTMNARDFWNGFWETHPDLRQHGNLITGLFDQNWEVLKTLNATQAYDRLAQLTRTEMDKILRTRGLEPPAEGDTPPAAKGGHQVTSRTPADTPPVGKAKEDGPKTPPRLSDVINSRRAAKLHLNTGATQ